MLAGNIEKGSRVFIVFVFLEVDSMMVASAESFIPLRLEI